MIMKCLSILSLLVVLALVCSSSGERETKVRQRSGRKVADVSDLQEAGQTSAMRETKVRQRSGRKIADVSDLQARGVSCRSKGETFCHANVIRQYGSTYGQICSNGDIVLMRMPV